MARLFRNVVIAIVALAAAAVFIGVVLPLIGGRVARAVPSEPSVAPKGEYIGTKQCSACHFKEYMVWKKQKHAKAFSDMPAKYYGDVTCLKCHITAYGVAGGYKGPSTPDLLGVTCEACHGPGSKHAAVAKKYTDKKVLTDEEKKLVNADIQRFVTNACLVCHTEQAGHKEHPKFDKQ
jgi:hypothetical protein